MPAGADPSYPRPSRFQSTGRSARTADEDLPPCSLQASDCVPFARALAGSANWLSRRWRQQAYVGGATGNPGKRGAARAERAQLWDRELQPLTASVSSPAWAAPPQRQQGATPSSPGEAPEAHCSLGVVHVERSEPNARLTESFHVKRRGLPTSPACSPSLSGGSDCTRQATTRSAGCRSHHRSGSDLVRLLTGALFTLGSATLRKPGVAVRVSLRDGDLRLNGHRQCAKPENRRAPVQDNWQVDGSAIPTPDLAERTSLHDSARPEAALRRSIWLHHPGAPA